MDGRSVVMENAATTVTGEKDVISEEVLVHRKIAFLFLKPVLQSLLARVIVLRNVKKTGAAEQETVINALFQEIPALKS